MFFSAILYYLVLVPISFLPFWALHGISRMVYVIMYYLTGYRKKVVLTNIRNSFPEKSIGEQKALAKKFYKQLCDVLVESQKIFTISKKQLIRHMYCVNPQVANQYYDQGKNIIIAVGHFNNWELMITGFTTFIKHQPVGIYQPLKNKFFNQKMIKARSKLGSMMLSVKHVRKFYEIPLEKAHATIFAIDQSPSNAKKSYWMQFLHQDTPVLFGTEYFAKAYNLPVIYACLKKIKRGYYQLELTNITDTPAETSHGEITELVTRALEQDIIAQPESWLWSHRRWKHKRVNGR